MKHILIGAVFFTPYNELSYSIFEGFESAMEDLKKVFYFLNFAGHSLVLLHYLSLNILASFFYSAWLIPIIAQLS